MTEIFANVIGPVAALVLLGGITGPRLNVDPAQLSRLAYWILGPAFMFDALARAELAGSLVAQLVVVSLAGMVGAGLICTVLAKGLGVQRGVVGAMAMSSAYGNVGNAGLAICIFALGDEIRPIASFVMLVVNTAGLIVGVGLASSEAGLGSALRRALTAPMAVAAFLAIAFNYTNSVTTLELPTLIDRVVVILAGALIPLMLYTLGIQLANQGRPKLGSDVAIVGAAKLMAAPAAAAVVAQFVGLDGDAASVAIIQSAMPPAVFTAVLALEHGFYVERVTTYLVTTTLAALVTLPVVLSLVT